MINESSCVEQHSETVHLKQSQVAAVGTNGLEQYLNFSAPLLEHEV